MILHAHAKVNLRLVVLAREEGGYHQLETIFCRLDLADRIELEPARDGVRIDVAGAQLGPPDQNLAYRAARAFFEAGGGGDEAGRGAAIRLEKRIPAGSGLGGGSSDAAAVLLGLNRLHGATLDRDTLLRIAGRLGADVPFFALDTPLALAWGRGDRLHPLPPPAGNGAPALLVMPPFAIATAEAYALLAERRREKRDPPGAAAIGPADTASWPALARLARNDFEDALFPRHPLLAAVRDELDNAGALIARMTGSGSALFGVWQDPQARDQAAAGVAAAFPQCRVAAVLMGATAAG